MKRRSTCYLRFRSPIAIEQYSRILFLFKQHRREGAEPLFTVEYPGKTVTADEEDQSFVLRLNREQTALFQENKHCYVDVHPYLQNGDEPAVPILEIFVKPTLYQETDLEV